MIVLSFSILLCKAILLLKLKIRVLTIYEKLKFLESRMKVDGNGQYKWSSSSLYHGDTLCLSVNSRNGDNSVDYYYSDGDLLDILTNSRRHKRKAARDLRYRWTNKEVPYTLANHFSKSRTHWLTISVSPVHTG